MRSQARALNQAIAEPLTGTDGTLQVGASTGMAEQEIDRVVRPEQLMPETDACMYEARSRGKETVCC